MSILVIGSSNTDMVIRTPRFPKPGETILGGDFLMNQGGKGANQAVAAARLGSRVTFICKVGQDLFGDNAINSYQRSHIHTDYILRGGLPTGVALIMVSDSGENNIVVAPGANGELSPGDIEKNRKVIQQNDIILLQLEIPVETVERTIELAYELGKKVVLNPAPATKLPVSIFQKLDIITPNEHEASLLTGIEVVDEKSAARSADHLHQLGIKTVIITMGALGAYLSTNLEKKMITGFPVKAIDTTAAGDVFNGALAVGLDEKLDIEKAILFGNRAASIAVTRPGAQNSIPERKEVIL